ncbi:hypothetical protein MTR67_017069 [Solanum verrucosum]|uniref:Uncharacterized protein n=1 Tax=Solanum verrucosum TaxID=315347 RepID=A0AAF0QH78_SOLVR|nr:hypothetical protein MTR67_017069 [Solanum verrucosum]
MITLSKEIFLTI